MKYPVGIKRTGTKKIEYANRGMTLEKSINLSNQYYLEEGKAVIYKKPTPIQIVRVDYPSRSHAVIKEAYFTVPSTLDYNGLYKGKYLDFDAKECKSKTSFPISNIHEHQIKHIKNVLEHGGIAFLIVSFTLLNEIYLLFGEDLLIYINQVKAKSIPLVYFKKKAHKIELKYIPRIDYLKIIDKYMEGEYDEQI